MKIVPVDETTLGKCIRKERCNLDKLINEFRDSNYDCVEVKEYPHKTAQSCWNSIKVHLRRNKIYTVQPMLRGNRIFLVKREI